MKQTKPKPVKSSRSANRAPAAKRRVASFDPRLVRAPQPNVLPEVAELLGLQPHRPTLVC